MENKETEKISIKVTGIQNFMGIDIPVIEGGFGEGQKVILAKTVAEIHEQPLKKINQLINENIDEFDFGIDILDLRTGYLQSTEFLEEVMTKQSISNSAHIYLLSEQGYAALVQLMKTPKAKEVRKKLRREYFAMREIINSEDQKKSKLLLTIYNGGQDAVAASKELAQMEVDKTVAPLLPKANFYDTVYQSKDCITMEQMAKILRSKDIPVGRNRLFSWLRGCEVLMQNNLPYQKFIENGCFTVREYTYYTKNNQEPRLGTQVLITPKGQDIIVSIWASWIKENEANKELLEKL